MPQKHSITSLMVLSTMAVVTLVLGVYVAVSYSFEKKRQWADLRSEANLTADQLATGLALPLWNLDEEQVEKLLASTMEDRAVAGILIRQSDGRGLIYKGCIRNSSDQMVFIDTAFLFEKILLEYRHITVLSDTLGELTLAYTPLLIERSLRSHLTIQISTIIILDIILILGLQLLLWKLILKPLRFVDRYADAIIGGHPETTDLQGIQFYGEIDRMRLSLQRMIGILDERYREVVLSRSDISREKDRLRVTLKSIADAVITTDENGLVTLMNPVAEVLTGNRLATALGRPVEEVLRIVDVDTHRTAENSVRIALQRRTIAASGTDRILLDIDGDEIRIADSAAPIFNDIGALTGVVLVFRDITEKRELEEQLRQSQKMDAVGQLAGGVAHDFNNMLGGIIGATELLFSSIKSGDPHFEYVQLIQRAAERAADLTRQLLAFSRKAKVRSMPVDIHAILSDSVNLLLRSFDKKISVTTSFFKETVFVTGDPALLENVFINLGINARDAMPAGGTLTFSTRRIASPSAPELEDQIGGPWIEVTVSDTGTGMSEEVLSHIFEPFFTTKEQGKGTGLGLAAVYGTVSDHGGTIHVESSVGHGTVFTLCFPISDGVAVTPPESPVPVMHTHGKTVLLADDEPVLRKVAGALLAERGIRVLFAVDGCEAVAVYRTSMKEIDLVILDVIMPNKNGLEAFEEIQQLNPAVRVLFASGFAPDKSISRILKDPCVVGYIQKPFRRNQLLTILSTVFPEE